MTDRNQFINSVKAQLDEWNADIGTLEAKIEHASDDTKQQLKNHLAKAHEARDAVTKKLAQLESSGEQSWDSAKGEVEHAWNAFKSTVNHFKSQF
jgi:septal ring factor EnvC (AmiA/AmiB activator)